jgi:hypothetical protein
MFLFSIVHFAAEPRNSVGANKRYVALQSVPCLAFARQTPLHAITIDLLVWFIVYDQWHTTTLAGTYNSAALRNGNSATALFYHPSGVAVAPNGVVVVVDTVSCTSSFLAFLVR